MTPEEKNQIIATMLTPLVLKRQTAIGKKIPDQSIEESLEAYNCFEGYLDESKIADEGYTADDDDNSYAKVCTFTTANTPYNSSDESD